LRLLGVVCAIETLLALGSYRRLDGANLARNTHSASLRRVVRRLDLAACLVADETRAALRLDCWLLASIAGFACRALRIVRLLNCGAFSARRTRDFPVIDTVVARVTGCLATSSSAGETIVTVDAGN